MHCSHQWIHKREWRCWQIILLNFWCSYLFKWEPKSNNTDKGNYTDLLRKKMTIRDYFGMITTHKVQTERLKNYRKANKMPSILLQANFNSILFLRVWVRIFLKGCSLKLRNPESFKVSEFCCKTTWPKSQQSRQLLPFWGNKNVLKWLILSTNLKIAVKI